MDCDFCFFIHLFIYMYIYKKIVCKRFNQNRCDTNVTVVWMKFGQFDSWNCNDSMVQRALCLKSVCDKYVAFNSRPLELKRCFLCVVSFLNIIGQQHRNEIFDNGNLAHKMLFKLINTWRSVASATFMSNREIARNECRFLFNKTLTSNSRLNIIKLTIFILHRMLRLCPYHLELCLSVFKYIWTCITLTVHRFAILSIFALNCDSVWI